VKTALSRLMCILGVLGIICVVPVRAEAQTLVPFYEYRYGNMQDFLYTTDFGELGNGGGGWWYLGFDMYVYNSELEGTIPLLRYYNSWYGKHHFTTDVNELDSSWTYEGIAGYIWPQQESGTVGIRRWYKWVSGGPVHLFTTSTQDSDTLLANGWTFEGIIGYAVPCTSSCF
jgi:hypothetical protein